MATTKIKFGNFTDGKTFYYEYMLKEILGRPILPVQLYYYFVAEELLKKSRDKDFLEKLNVFTGIVKYETLQTIQIILLKNLVYVEELGYARLVAREMDILTKELNDAINARHSGSLKSTFIPNGYTIETIGKEVGYQVVVERQKKYKKIEFAFKKKIVVVNKRA